VSGIPHGGYPSKVAAIKAFRSAHPDSTVPQIALALHLSNDDVYNALRPTRPSERGAGHRRPVDPNRKSKLLPMLDGAGDRKEDCRLYEACLTRAAIQGGEAHCPAKCADYRAVPEDYFRAEAMVSRDHGTAVHLRTVGRGTW
jgi:hypothetical protein